MKRLIRRAISRFANRIDTRISRHNLWRFLSSPQNTQDIEKGTFYSELISPFMQITIPEDAKSILEMFGRPCRTNVSLPTQSLLSSQWRESLIEVKNTCFVEPERGWIIVSPYHLVQNCLIDSLYVPKPSLKTHIAFRYFAPDKIKKIDRAVHFRDSGEGNYWHFLNDMLGGRLRMLKECGVDENIPIVMSETLFSRPFFQEVLTRTTLGRRTFVLQRNELLRSEGIYYFETSRHSRKAIEYVWNFLDVPVSNSKSNRRIFLARDSRVGRGITNMGEIEAVLERFDFEMVDTGQMSLDEQIEMFGGTRYVIGVHGAGLTNIMFRRKADLNLLEIFPPMSSYSLPKLAPPPLHYFWLARALDFGYGVMFGEADVLGDYRSPFRVNAVELSKKIAEMLER